MIGFYSYVRCTAIMFILHAHASDRVEMLQALRIAIGNKNLNAVNLVLGKFYANKGNWERAQRHIMNIAEDYFIDKDTGGVLQQPYLNALRLATFSLKQGNTGMAIEVLTKMMFLTPESSLLLYKVYNDDKDCCYVADILLKAVEHHDPIAMINLGELYFLEALSKGLDTITGFEYLVSSQLWHNKAARSYKHPYAMLCFLRNLSPLNERLRSSMVATLGVDVHAYATLCMDAIDKQSDHTIECMKEKYPRAYERALMAIKRYCVNQ